MAHINFKSIKIDVNNQQIGATNVGLIDTPNAPFSAETPVNIINEQIAALHVNSPTQHANVQHVITTSILSMPAKTTTPNSPQSYSLDAVLRKQGYMPLKQYTKTLQGSIWQILCTDKNIKQETQIVKVTNKSLHQKSIAYVNGKSYIVLENIIKETELLRYLTNNQPPVGLAQYKTSFSDKYNYFLVQEDAGQCMFNFVKSSHMLIKQHKIYITEWHRFCQNAMSQMINILDWLHNDMNCCHMDVSLENFTIKNIRSTMMAPANQSLTAQRNIQFSNNFIIKIIDFGVAEVFTKTNNGTIDFRCNKYVGKTAYKAAKVYGKKEIFDARSADCWSLGVCFCMMFIGVTLWKKASYKDPSFRYIMSGKYKLIEVFQSWGILHYVTAEILDLLLGLFRSEEHRLTIKQLKEHCWFNT